MTFMPRLVNPGKKRGRVYVACEPYLRRPGINGEKFAEANGTREQ
jgi:hypothetical protein